MSKILILGAHPDDIEYGCGATLNKLIEQKNRIFIAVFSPAMQIPENKHILTELKNSMNVYGIQDKDYAVFDFRTRMFPITSPEIQDKVFQLKKQFAPDEVYCPSPNALHPDHATLGRCVASVFQETSIFAYEDVRGNHHQLINYWQELMKRDVEKKIKALKCYKSQFKRGYMNFDKIYHLISARGLQIGREYAEGFEVLRRIE